LLFKSWKIRQTIWIICLTHISRISIISNAQQDYPKTECLTIFVKGKGARSSFIKRAGEAPCQ
ncbi:MAG: hypothetical protein WBO13_09335, partial [Vibrio fluvialis]